MPTILRGDVTGPLEANRIPALRDALDALVAACEAIRRAMPEEAHEQPLTEAQLRATPLVVNSADDALLFHQALRALLKLTTTTTGLRVDLQGGTVVATPASTANGNFPVGYGYNTQQGQGIQQSYIAFQTGFRRNLTVA